jgi:hypothetical protein
LICSIPVLLALFLCASVKLLAAVESTNAPTNGDAQPTASERATAKENESTNAPSLQGFAEFKIVAERNIFNANRRAGQANRPPPRTERPPKTESFSLVGTWLDPEEGNSAFFLGTESDYNKVLKEGDMIGGCKVTRVTLDSVKLLNGEIEIDLAMGLQMKRQEEGKWEVAVGTATSASSGSSPGGRERSFGSDNRRDRGPSGDPRWDRSFSGNTARRGRGATEAAPESKPAEETSSPSSADDILQKMMQRREQELNN